MSDLRLSFQWFKRLTRLPLASKRASQWRSRAPRSEYLIGARLLRSFAKFVFVSVAARLVLHSFLRRRLNADVHAKHGSLAKLLWALVDAEAAGAVSQSHLRAFLGKHEYFIDASVMRGSSLC